MNRKILSTILCVLICLSVFNSTAFASNISKVESEVGVINSVNDKISELNKQYKNTKLEINYDLYQKKQKNYDAEILDEMNSSEEILCDKNHTPVLKFNSIQELEDFFDKVESYNLQEKEVVIKLHENVNENRMMSTEYNGDHTFTWNDSTWWQYLTLAWEIFIDKNLRVEYVYTWNANNQTEFVRAKSAESWISGATIIREWTQKGQPTMNILSKNRKNDQLKTSVTGVYILGVSIEVQGVSIPIGLTNTETWVRTLIYE